MQLHGRIHHFPKELKLTILAFIVTLSVGFYSSIRYVDNTTNIQATGIETQYLGNESDGTARVMKFRKSKQEMLSILHSHILSLSVIFFLLALILSTTSLPIRWKYFLMLEPFVSIILTFGGIYYLWTGITWLKYLVICSGALMTLSFVLSSAIIFQQVLYRKPAKT